MRFARSAILAFAPASSVTLNFVSFVRFVFKFLPSAAPP